MITLPNKAHIERDGNKDCWCIAMSILALGRGTSYETACKYHASRLTFNNNISGTSTNITADVEGTSCQNI